MERYVTAEVANYVNKNYAEIQRPELVGQDNRTMTVVDFDTRMALCAEGIKSAARRRYPEAVYYSGVMLNDREYVEAYIVRGVSKIADNKANEAMADLSRAIELAPTNASAFAHRAEAHLALGERVQALADVKKAIQLDPVYGPFYAILGRVELAGQESAAALADLDRALKLNPKRPALHNARGLAYLSLGDRAKAQEEFDTASRLAPADPAAWLNRGLILESEKNYSQAIAEFSRAIAIDSEYAPAYVHRAGAYDQLANDTDSAETRQSYQEKAANDREKLRGTGFQPALPVE
jgi:tetratricopeptide (TPR) repeat protein